MRRCPLTTLPLLLALLLPAGAATAAERSGAGADAAHWLPLGESYDRDISGLLVLAHDDSSTRLLVAHDNKYPGEVRLATVLRRPDGSHAYHPLAWPPAEPEPVDIESLCRHPEGGFVVLTSRGAATHLELDLPRRAVRILARFALPVPVPWGPNVEGLAMVRLGDSIHAIWGDRGSDARPGLLLWGRFNPLTRETTLEDSTSLAVPWPLLSEVRHISELKLDDRGRLWITSASEASNDGPFDGALYQAGSFRLGADGRLRYQPAERLVPVRRYPGRKVEAFDFAGGSPARRVLGTDNENEGSALLFEGME